MHDDGHNARMGYDGGRFLFINGILCKTADGSGAFRPRDVFSRIVPHAALHDEAGVMHAEDDGRTTAEPTTSSPSATTAMHEAADSDCPLFNAFGVLSRGALIDAWAGTFVDAADAVPCRPAMLASSGTTSRESATAQEDATVSVQEANMQAYRIGSFADIRAEAVLSLCSSLKPFAVHRPGQHAGTSGAQASCPCSVCAVHTPPSWPEAPWLTRQRAARIARTNVEAVLQRTCLPASDAAAPTKDRQTSRKHRTGNKATQRVDAFTSLWRRVEAFRLHNIAAEPGSVYLPSSIPFRFQCGGVVLRLPSAPARKRGREASDPTDAAAAEVEEGGGGVAGEDGAQVQQQHGAISFTCFAGLPLFIRGAYSTPRNDLMQNSRNAHRAHAVRRLLRPARCEAGVHPVTSDGEGAGAVMAEVTQARVRGDGIETFLVPPASLPSRVARGWWTFRVYFAHLGVLRASVPGDASVSAATTVYKLCPDADFSAARAVQQKRREVYLRRRHARRRRSSSAGGGTSPSSNLALIADVWDYLLAHERDALMRRLQLLETHLAQLHTDDVGV